MAHYLSLDGSSGRVDVPALTMASNFEMEIDLTYYTASGDRFFFSGFTSGNAGRWYVGTYNNTVWWRLGSGFSAATSTALADGARYKIKLMRSGDNFTLQVDGVTIATRTQAFTMQAFSRIGSSQDPLYFAKIDIYYLSYSDIGAPSNNRYYDPSSTGGSGSTLVDTTGGQNGTLNGTYAWVFYNLGSSTQDVVVLNTQQSAIAPQVALTATQNQTIAAASQATSAAALLITAVQLPIVQSAQQSALASSLSISAVQQVAIANSDQSNNAPVLTIDQSPAATQLIGVLSASQQSIAPSIAVAAEQAIALQHAEQSADAGQLTVTAEQRITVQNAQLQSVADIPVVTALQLVTVGGSAQQAAAASVAITQIPSGPITRTIDFKTITARLVTPRFTAKRTTPTFTAKLAS